MKISKLMDLRQEARLLALETIALQEGVNEEDVPYLITKVPAIAKQWKDIKDNYINERLSQCL